MQVYRSAQTASGRHNDEGVRTDPREATSKRWRKPQEKKAESAGSNAPASSSSSPSSATHICQSMRAHTSGAPLALRTNDDGLARVQG
eukprot:3814264-Rhodomonas_salina.2